MKKALHIGVEAENRHIVGLEKSKTGFVGKHITQLYLHFVGI